MKLQTVARARSAGVHGSHAFGLLPHRKAFFFPPALTVGRRSVHRGRGVLDASVEARCSFRRTRHTDAEEPLMNSPLLQLLFFFLCVLPEKDGGD